MGSFPLVSNLSNLNTKSASSAFLFMPSCSYHVLPATKVVVSSRTALSSTAKIPLIIDKKFEDQKACKRGLNLSVAASKGESHVLSSLLSSDQEGSFLVRNNGDQVPVSELKQKMVGLYFCINLELCNEFTHKLVEIHKILKEKGENFEVVLIFGNVGNDEQGFKETLSQTPWLTLPFKDERITKLAHYFGVRTAPRLVIIGADGTTLNPNATSLINEHGITAYPFTREKVAELAEIEKAKLASLTLESILVSGEKDCVIDKSGSKVLVSQLVGKHVLIYFSGSWCSPCRAFTPKLIEVYNELKAKKRELEVIFVSRDFDQASFEKYYSDMPWLALPFGDERESSLSRSFKVGGIPCLVAIGPDGKTITTEARRLITAYGADAFPLTEEHIRNLEEELLGDMAMYPKVMRIIS